VQTSRVYRVSGTVVGLNWPVPKPSEGESENPIAVPFAGMGEILLMGKSGQMRQQKFAQDGRFEFANVLPGTYQAQLIVFAMTGSAPSVKM
jgi:hypothetical protein